MHHAVPLRGGQMYVSPGEVGDAADVIRVEVGDHDVADIARVVPEVGDLAYGGFGRIEGGPDQEPRRPEPSPRRRDVLQTDAGVDEREAVSGLNEQHVTHELR